MKKLLILFSILGLSLTGCTNQKLEDQIKNLEKRVANLEKAQGITPISNTTTASNASENPDGKYPVISFDENEYDFGTIKEGDIVNHTFKFKNTGDFPLIINKATASCGCTIPQWPKDPIPVGGSGEIQVKFNSRGKQNQQTKYITISANTKPESTRIILKGMVTPSEKTDS